MTTQDIQGIASQLIPGATVRDPQTFLDFLDDQSRRVSAGQPLSQIVPAPVQQSGGGGRSFMDLLTDSLISDGVLDNVRDAGLFGRIGANIIGELTSPLGLASTALLATGVGAPLGAALKTASVGTRLAPVGRLAAGALSPVLGSARGLGPSAIARSPGLLGRSLAAEAGVAGGAIAGGGLAQEVGQIIPGPTRSTPGQVALGLGGGLVGGGLAAGGIRQSLASPADRALAGVDDLGTARAAGPEGVGEAARDLSKLPTQEKFAELLRLAPESEAALEARRSVERSGRAAAGEERLAGLTDPAARRRAFLSAQSGELPGRRIFEPLAHPVDGVPNLDSLKFTEFGTKGGINAEDISFVSKRIGEVYGQPRTRHAEGETTEAFVQFMTGSFPSPRKLDLLRPILGDATIDRAIEITKSRGRRAFESAVDIAGLPRGIMSSFDMSAVLRQGAILTTSHPKAAFYKGRNSPFGMAVRAAKNKEYALLRQAERAESPVMQRLTSETLKPQDRLFLQQLDGTDLTRRDEIYISRLLSKIPGVAASERFFATYLNEMRSAVSNIRLQKIADANGITIDELAKSLSNDAVIAHNRATNFMTGRGSLGPLENPRSASGRVVKDVLSIGFWSPRLLLSRFQTLTAGGQALRNLRAEDPHVRAISREIARDLAIFSGGMTLTVGSLSFLPGVSVERNPKSSDFGKVRVGNTRYDPWAGFQQVGRYATQFVTGERKSASSGKINGVDRDEVLGRFLRSKLAPGLPAILVSDLPENLILPGLTGGGENFIGEPITGALVTPGAGARALVGTTTLGQRPAEPLPAELNALIDNMIPLLAQDIAEALETDGIAAGVGSGLGATFGLGTTSFGENTKSVAVEDRRQAARNPSNPFARR